MKISPRESKKNNYKNILQKLSKSNFIIHEIITPDNVIQDMNYDGNIQFGILCSDIGFNLYELLTSFNNEVFSYHMINFIGELYVRNNLDCFHNIFMKMSRKKINELSNSIRHAYFGIKIDASKEMLIFSFNVVLLNSLLTEDFKKCFIC